MRLRRLTRILFNSKVNGLTAARIRAYWARTRFSGRKRPPRQFQDKAEAFEYRPAHEGAVGYVSQDMPCRKGGSFCIAAMSLPAGRQAWPGELPVRPRGQVL